ncbi:MAG: hypothetical protein EOO01_14590 [Chitinophagaceae bacterium]|nr:MAG: hypothetical protein EOO01_14590 [Chitinophagaceae bacterium]
MKKTTNTLILSFVALAGLLFSCSKMDSKYSDFIKDGPIKYTGRPDSLKIHPGNGRVKLSWVIFADPKVNRALIYWNNRKDSINVPIIRTGGTDSVNVDLNNMNEGTYVFEIFTFDSNGNKSVKTEIVGNVYGDNYKKSILIRPVNVASVIGRDSARIDWGAVSYKEGIASELNYTDLSGTYHERVVSSDTASTLLTNVNATTTFTYRTKYLPSPLAIDSFYTDYKTVRIKGSPVEVSKTGWTITASSEDVSGNRRAVNLIDGNKTNLFVNQIVSGNTYPHWVIVDMKAVVNDVEGFYFYQRTQNPLKTLEIQISNNGTDWETLGDFVLANSPTVNTGSPQTARPVYADFSRVRSFRYFKQIFKNDHGNSVNVNIHETGVFIR